MKNKPFEMCLLFDFYGDILTDKQKELFDLYYNEDLSLAEIAEHAGITRQGVRDGIVRAEHILRDTEKKLGLVKRYGNVENHIERLAADIQQLLLINSTKYRNQDIARLVTDMQQSIRALSGS